MTLQYLIKVSLLNLRLRANQTEVQSNFWSVFTGVNIVFVDMSELAFYSSVISLSWP